ncbi:zf-HC2 domain-containing protein [Actinoplanes sp. NPDC049316]|uniref:anti-sigma factor family protein n=1 Tax=Actinoplanes sp. NPDC049316 TaxID=3154727 RepID=UPI003418DA63
MRCDHEHDDGAYVLGALSPAERAAYERHLATCSFCREAVADIAVLPGLLGRLDPADFERLLEPDFSAPQRPPHRRATMPDLVTAAQTTRREERKRVRWRVLGTALAAACLALVVGIGAVFWMGRGTAKDPALPGPVVAMTPENDQVPVSAQISLAGAPGGTKVHLLCAYNRGNQDAEPYTIRLMAYGPDRESEQLGSWIASPGKEFSMSGVTHFTDGMLSRLALVRNDGRTLLAYDVP